MDTSTMRVGIIGAGMAGLAAARRLQEAGHACVVFEKSKGLGGRLATRRIDEFTFDTGVTSLSPGTSALGIEMTEKLDTTDLIEIHRRIDVHEYGRISPGSSTANKGVRYGYRNGVTTIAKLLAEGLEIRLSTPVECINEVANRYELHGELFDRVIITSPTPQTQFLLQTVGERRALDSVRYRSCLSVLLGYGTPDPDVPYFALIDPEQRNPLVWLSLESVKVPGRAPEGACAMVAQLNAAYSAEYFAAPDAEIVSEAVAQVRRLLGHEFDHPQVSEVKRWKYSQPELSISFDSANPPGTRVLVAGDGMNGGRAELAYDSGLRAALRLMEEA